MCGIYTAHGYFFAALRTAAYARVQLFARLHLVVHLEMQIPHVVSALPYNRYQKTEFRKSASSQAVSHTTFAIWFSRLYSYIWFSSQKGSGHTRCQKRPGLNVKANYIYFHDDSE